MPNQFQKNGLSVIVPCFNEEGNLTELCNRISQNLTSNNIPFEIIIVDDHSKDQTALLIDKLSVSIPLVYHLKNGKKGKAYSIIEGAELARFDTLAMIDADLQYPPEALAKMYFACDQKTLLTTHRSEKDTSWLRKKLSDYNRVIMQYLTGFKFDIQSGLKVFSKEVIAGLHSDDVTPWTLDLALLDRASLLGHKIDSVKIKFAARKEGESKVSFTTIFEILLHTIKYRLFKKNQAQYFAPNQGMLGAGVIHKGQKYVTHTTLSHEKNSLQVFTNVQIWFIFFVALLFIIALSISLIQTLIFFLAFISLIHFFDMSASLLLIFKSLVKRTEIHVSAQELSLLDPQKLPIYTILCPLYKEAHIIPDFLTSMAALDYPKDRLEVMLLLEEDDKESIDVVANMHLPSYVHVEVVPYSLPKTKPKACNWGLLKARGEYIVIYDAEDIPDHDQLKKAIVAFAKLPKNTFCLQAKLNYHNPSQNLLTRFFTAEYSMWFETVLPGLQSVDTFIPLGGTSNHFRTKDLLKLEGWDAFNVTEDCDLGMRVFSSGYRTAIIDSQTLEEANSSLPNWIRQRSRWVKGYMQSYLIQMRHPWQFLKNHGSDFWLFQFTIGGRIFSLFINPILWMTTIIYFVARAKYGEFIESLFPGWIFYLALASLIVGNFMYMYFYMIGTVKAKKYTVTKWSLAIPLYWLAISLAAVKAFYQLLFKPHYWEKTLHGLHLKNKKIGISTESVPNTFVVPEKRTEFTLSPRVREVFTYFCVTLFAIYSAFLVSIYLGYFDPSRSSLNIVILSMVSIVYMYQNYLAPITKNKNVHKSGKILIMNWRDIKNPFAGGAEVYLHELAKNYTRMGLEVVMLTGNNGSLAIKEVIDGVKIHRSALSSLNFLFNLFLRLGNRQNRYPKYIDGAVYLSNFINYLRFYRGKVDFVIDSQNGLPFFTPLFVKEKTITLIHHVHQEVFYKSLPPVLSTFAAFLERFVMTYLYKDANYIAVSQSTKNDLIRLNWSSENKISVVHPGVDLSKYRVSNKKFTRPTLLFVGRLTYYKSLNVLLKIAQELKDKIPNLQVLIAGDGDMRKNLEKTSRKLQVDHIVQFLGKVSEEEKIALYQGAHIFINPSFMEGWGITNIEANACGTPVIASDVSGLRNSVLHGESGYLVKYADVESFCERILFLLGDKKTYKYLRTESVYWANNFSWDKTSKHSLQVLESLDNQNSSLLSISKLYNS